MSIEGRLQIRLDCNAGRIVDVHIHSSRPLAASQVFVGKTPEQLLTLLPMLYTVCGNGQAFAALLALRQALGLALDPVTDTARHMLIDLETLREHCWRILLDWPAFAVLESDKRQMAPFMRLLKEFQRALFGEQQPFQLHTTATVDEARLVQQIDELEVLLDQAIFGSRLTEWGRLQSEVQLFGWLQNNESVSAQLLRSLYTRHWCDVGCNDIGRLPSKLDPNEITQRLSVDRDTAEFVQTPDWQGRCYEATVLNRQQDLPLIADCLGKYGNGLLTRLVARLQEVASTPVVLKRRMAHLCAGIAQPTPSVETTMAKGYGLAQVQAARGLLIHHLQLQQGRILHYGIVAPTEWNFHPKGVVAAGLKQLRADDLTVLRNQAAFWINAVDPCVRFELLLSAMPGSVAISKTEPRNTI